MTCVGLATEEHLFSGALRIEEKVKKKKVRERRAVKFNSIALFSWFYSDNSQSSKTSLTVLLCHCFNCLVDVMV